jgi:hypothetical protein
LEEPFWARTGFWFWTKPRQTWTMRKSCPSRLILY